MAKGFNRAALVVLLIGLPVAIGSGAAAASSPPMVRVGSAPRVPAGARPLGAVSSSASLSGTVVLKPRDSAALARFIAEVSDPASTMFHRYLPAGAFAGRFGPTEATIDAVRSQLTTDGLRVTGVSSDGLLIDFSSSAARIEHAFRTGVERYRLADGSTGQTMTSAATLPSTVAGSVAGIVGLNDLARARPAEIVRAPAADRGKIERAATATFSHPSGAPTACPAATADAEQNGGLTDDQIAHAYGAFGLYGSGDLGQGQHIALYELEPFLYSDVSTFDTCYFGSGQAAAMLSRLHVIQVDGGQPSGPGSGEANLDVEDLSAMAPDATIDVYEGPSPGTDGVDYDPVDEYAAIIDADRDQVISTSWGLCEQAIQAGQPGLQQAENLLFEQAAAQGQSVFAAAGDNGSDDCDTFETTKLVSGQNPVSVDDPGSQPYVVSVGGTTITDASEPPVERVWNDGGTGGAGGGGISESWTMPTWQRASTVPGIPLPGSADYTSANKVEEKFGYPSNFCESTVAGAGPSAPCRVVPDVSAQGDEFTGAVTVYYDGTWQTVGGTSSSTPIWAAMLAVTNASQTCASQPSTRDGVGFVSPLLYAVASNPAHYAASFTDVATGNNDIYHLDHGLVFPATAGYDLTTGLGSPQLTGPDGSAGLAYYLCSFAAAPARPAVTGLSPTYGSTAGGERVTITGNGFESGGVPDVAGVEVGGAQLASSAFTVNGPTSITATLPPARETLPPNAPAPQDGAGPADVIVTATGGESSAPGPSSIFEYVDTSATGVVPSITAVIPFGGLKGAPGTATVLGSGFSGATTVTFGGVPARSFTVDGPNQITAAPPPFSGQTACTPLPSTGVYRGENASNDICQVQVRVTNAHGTSATGDILAPLEGTIEVNNLGVLVAPSGCGCETQLAPTEFDYLPAPRVTSVSTAAGPASWLNEDGTSVLTAHGVGFAPMDIDWADFGDPALGSSMDVDYVYVTGTEMQIVAPPQTATSNPLTVPFSVKTLAGQSNAVPVTYAPTGASRTSDLAVRGRASVRP
jgi:Pro-kumamolisin, activation domain/IPT/TIG domain